MTITELRPEPVKPTGYVVQLSFEEAYCLAAHLRLSLDRMVSVHGCTAKETERVARDLSGLLSKLVNLLVEYDPSR